MTQILSFGYDGDNGLGDRLLAAVLRGAKTATSSLAVEYLSGEPLPHVGERLTLVDHHGGVHGVVETTRVTITPLHLVGDDVARDEGEGFADAADWRRGHVSYCNECEPHRKVTVRGDDDIALNGGVVEDGVVGLVSATHNVMTDAPAARADAHTASTSFVAVSVPR